MWVYLLCLLACMGGTIAQNETRVVRVEQGLVRGYKDSTGNFFSFHGVPYATAPTGRDKFKAPLPPRNWTGTFDAVNKTIACPQYLPIPTQEDCLVSNIFVPNTNATYLPVIINVHGGGYSSAAGYFFPLTNLAATQKTVVVTFNYRLSMHGFLCLGTERIPGNAGMKDQVALLRWVNKNIASFGGNPDDVTISGCSAGGGSVDFLTLSPMTKGLFKKVITDSGTVLGVTGPQVDPTANAKRYARNLNFSNVDNLQALEEFYINSSLKFLMSGSDQPVTEKYRSSLLFAPCVERDVGQEMFLHDTPVNIIKKGSYPKIPVMYGFSEMEGLIRMGEFDYLKNRMNESFADFIPEELTFGSKAQKATVVQQIKNFYFGNQGITELNVQSYVNYFTDVMFAYPMLRVAKLRKASINDTIYLFQYSFVNKDSALVPNTTTRGPGHCQQFLAVADEDVTNATTEYRAMKEVMRKLWIDFINTGNTTPANSSLPTWPTINGYLSPYMILNSTSRLVQGTLLEERVRFWDSIYDKYYRQPVPPSTASAGASIISNILLTCVMLLVHSNNSN